MQMLKVFSNIVKHNILNGETNLKAERFVKKLKDYTKQICAELRLNISFKRRKQKIECPLTININDTFVEETWKRKRKSVLYSHFEGRSLERVAKKYKIEASTKSSKSLLTTKRPEVIDLSSLNLGENSTQL